ncbi:hypothetical protein AAFF_G00384280 [Aldrovandia affinis]|uniref:Endonuclease/exonuclease/phosphatase domain-containing protein n=1 Tax=Aldrovandia affinis TaxID=143900 RepID=A0AAD7SFH9_9TELE|nr:hypothetical protein AAFF_G00384280 [Aldrovandia affinis]
MVSPRARKALRRVHPHTNRMLSADFEGSPVTTVMSVYSPTNVALIEELERFYDDLRTAIHHVPAHNFLIILGDFNARLGPEDAPFTYHTNTNRNGEHLAALLTKHELLAANTLFRKRMGKRWTFQDRATSMRRQLDYILVRKKWRKSILNAESYSCAARTRVEEARRSFVREGTAESQEELNGAKQQLFSTYDRIKGEELMEKVKKVETVHGERRYKESWKVINEMSGRKRSREGQLAGCSPEERVTSWFTHFRDLLGTHPTVDGLRKRYLQSSQVLKLTMAPSQLRSLPQ